MDWAFQAARRKTQRVAGGSRSIIETLNVFNNVSDEGQQRIDLALREANEWFNSEILAAKAETGKLGRQEEEKSAMVSPEKTLNKVELGGGEIEEDGEVPASGTPLRAGLEIPSATPKSLADDNYTEEVSRGQDAGGFRTGKSAQSGKVSSWSPYKVDKSLKGAAAGAEQAKVADKWGLTEEVRTSTASDSNMTSKSLEQIVRDRSQRRSNMFVPLPSRDPLVVQQAALAAPKTGPIAPGESATGFLGKKAISASPVDVPVLAHKRVPARTTQSPIHSSTSTRISRATSSVFDRLSSLPTKSFENKVASRFAGRRISASSSIDVTGSPIRRTSPLHKNSGSTETSIQDTLKNIFFARETNSKLGDVGSRSLRNKVRVGKNGTRVSPLSKNAKLSRYIVPHTETNRGLQSGKSGSRVQPQKIDAIEKRTVPSKANPTQDSAALASPGEQLLFGPAKSPLNKSEAIDGTSSNFESKTSPQKLTDSHASSSGNKSKHQDRLTKFQLIPPVESEKDDLKEKLNKRLSEVMRTQQNQHRRRNDQQKRKSQLDEDFKRRTRIWNEMKETSFTVSNAAHRSSNITPVQHNTVLHDLNIIDHRTVIGEVDESRNPTAGNQTLPEIQSDSDDDIDFTLASWAKSPYLQDQLFRQQNWDPKKIFGPIPPLHIDQIFPNSRTNKLKPLQPSAKKI